jgi:hypothetical protein
VRGAHEECRVLLEDGLIEAERRGGPCPLDGIGLRIDQQLHGIADRIDADEDEEGHRQ